MGSRNVIKCPLSHQALQQVCCHVILLNRIIKFVMIKSTSELLILHLVPDFTLSQN